MSFEYKTLVAPLPTTPGGDIAHDLAAIHVSSPTSTSNLTGANHNKLDQQDPGTGVASGQLQAQKRRYSVGLYEYTKSLWEDCRYDIERRSSASSISTSTRPTVVSRDSNDATQGLGSIAALH